IGDFVSSFFLFFFSLRFSPFSLFFSFFFPFAFLFFDFAFPFSLFFTFSLCSFPHRRGHGRSQRTFVLLFKGQRLHCPSRPLLFGPFGTLPYPPTLPLFLPLSHSLSFSFHSLFLSFYFLLTLSNRTSLTREK